MYMYIIFAGKYDRYFCSSVESFFLLKTENMNSVKEKVSSAYVLHGACFSVDGCFVTDRDVRDYSYCIRIWISGRKFGTLFPDLAGFSVFF